MSKVVLRELTEADEAAFFQGMKEWEGEELDWYTFVWQEGMSFAEHLAILKNRKEGIGLREGLVPDSMLYGFVDGKIIGRVSIRHELNDYLRARGGHIGYSVAPRFRGRGYASVMVEQALPYAKSVGIDRMLITCSDTNVASWKIIEKIGGELEEKVFDELKGEMIRKYWLEL